MASDRCPRCGGFDPSIPRRQVLEADGFYCTPLGCDAWTVTHRLTKQGPKPIRVDGRADLRVATGPDSNSPHNHEEQGTQDGA